MKVILKCRFGDHLPDPRRAVELDKKDADYLISQGLAELPKDDTIVQGSNVKELQAEVKSLTAQVVSLTEERDNAVTALALAKGVGDGTDNTPTK
jgi:hypothetical protein